MPFPILEPLNSTAQRAAANITAVARSTGPAACAAFSSSGLLPRPRLQLSQETRSQPRRLAQAAIPACYAIDTSAEKMPPLEEPADTHHTRVTPRAGRGRERQALTSSPSVLASSVHVLPSSAELYMPPALEKKLPPAATRSGGAPCRRSTPTMQTWVRSEPSLKNPHPCGRNSKNRANGKRGVEGAF